MPTPTPNTPPPEDLPDLTDALWRDAHQDTPRGGGIEAAFVEHMTCMRNGEDPHRPVLVFTETEWNAFVAGAKDGEFHLATSEQGN